MHRTHRLPKAGPINPHPAAETTERTHLRISPPYQPHPLKPPSDAHFISRAAKNQKSETGSACRAKSGFSAVRPERETSFPTKRRRKGVPRFFPPCGDPSTCADLRGRRLFWGRGRRYKCLIDRPDVQGRPGEWRGDAISDGGSDLRWVCNVDLVTCLICVKVHLGVFAALMREGGGWSAVLAVRCCSEV